MVTKEIVILESHAEKRSQQRGVSLLAVVMAAQYGQPCRLPGGAVLRMLTSRVLMRIAEEHEFLSPAQLERLVGAVVITKDRGTVRMVKTVLPKEKRGGPRKVFRHHAAHGRWAADRCHLRIDDPTHRSQQVA